MQVSQKHMVAARSSAPEFQSLQRNPAPCCCQAVGLCFFFLKDDFSSVEWCDTTSKDTTALCRERCDCFCDCFNCQQKQQLHCLESSCTRNCLLEPNSCCLSFHRSVLICISFAKYFENSQGRIQSKEEQG